MGLRVKFKPIASLIFSACLLACNDIEDNEIDDNTSAREIFAMAERELERGRGVEAGDLYLEVERLYPYTLDADRALILAAQAYHDDGALLESRAAAERYIEFFPGSKDAALASYLIALSYYDGISDVKRDQSKTFEALKALERVMDQYPGTRYAALSRPKFIICLNQLAGKEMDIGRYYLADRHYTAAIARFKAVLREYPENAHKAEAYHRLVEAYIGLGLRSEALTALAILRENHPGSPWRERAEALLNDGAQANSGVSVLRQILTGDRL